jgi:transposase
MICPLSRGTGQWVQPPGKEVGHGALSVDRDGAGNERAEVILKTIEGQLTWIQAAEILGISARTMRRWKQRDARQGYDGLFDRRTRQPSPRRAPLPMVQQVLRLYREHYFDVHVRHFHERLHEAHRIHLSYTWV